MSRVADVSESIVIVAALAFAVVRAPLGVSASAFVSDQRHGYNERDARHIDDVLEAQSRARPFRFQHRLTGRHRWIREQVHTYMARGGATDDY